MSEYSDAFNNSFAVPQMIVDRQRKNAAYHALAQAYGPTAGDPDLAAKLQNNAFNAQDQPLRVQAQQIANTGAGIANTGAQQTNDANAQTNQLKNLYTVGALLKNTGDPSLLDNPLVQKFSGLTPEMVPQVKQLILGQDGKVDPSRVDGLLAAGIGPTGAQVTGAGIPVQNPDGTYSVVKSTKSGGSVMLPLNGAQPVSAIQGADRIAIQQGNLAERQKQDAYLRAHGWTNTQIQAYRASTTANNSLYRAGDGQSLPSIPSQPVGSPTSSPAALVQADKLIKQYGVDGAIQHAPSDEIASAVADRASAKINPGGAQPSSQADPLAHLPPKGRAAAVSAAQMVVNANTMLANTNTILDKTLGQVSAFTTGPGALLAHIPGTAATNLKENLDTIKANVAQAILTSMKGTNGNTGIGRILASEYANFQKTLGAVDQTQSAEAVKFHLNLVKQSLSKMNAMLNNSYRQQWKTTPEAALGMDQPATPAQGNGWAIKVVK